MDMKQGQWATIRGNMKIVAREIKGVTTMCFYAQGAFGDRDTRYDKYMAVFVGPKEAAKLLAEQLTSSDAQCREDQRKAVHRRMQRDEELIKKANETVVISD